MDENRIVISGPQRMQGELLVQGSKNAALPILAAAVLADGIFVLHHCPEISDVDHMLELLQTAGCRVRRESQDQERERCVPPSPCLEVCWEGFIR